MADTIVKYIMEVDSKGAVRSMNRLDNEVEEVNRDLKKTTKTGKDMNEGLKKSFNSLKVALGAVAIGVFVSQLKDASKAAFNFAKDSVDAINRLNDISVKSGLSAQGVQAVIMAFEGSGQSAAAAESFMARMPRTFADLSVSGTRASKVAEALGIQLKDTTGNIKTSDELLVELTKKFQSIEDPTQRATTAFLLFGRSAGSFLQSFGATAEFEDFLSFTKEFGVDAEKGASKAAKFQETLAALQIVFDGSKQTIADTIGAVEFFSNALRKTGEAVVFLTAFMQHADRAFQLIDHTLKSIFSYLIGIPQRLLLSINPLTRIISLADQVGLIDTSKITEPLSQGVESAAIKFLDLEDAIAAGNKAAQDFDDKIDKLLGGIKLTKEDTDLANESLKRLEEILQQTGETAKETSKEIESAMQTIKNQTKSTQEQIDDFLLTDQEKLRSEFERTKFDLLQLASITGDLASLTAALDAEYQLFGLRMAALKGSEWAKKQEEETKRLQDAFDSLNDSIERSVNSFKSLASGDVLGALDIISSKLSGAAAIAANITLAVLDIAKGIGSAGIQRAEALGLMSDEAARREAKKDIEENIRNQARAIEIGLQVLPEILIGVLPGILMESTIRIVDAIIHLPHGIFLAIKDLFKSDKEIATVFNPRRKTKRNRKMGRNNPRLGPIIFA